jgi:hypothetical protein
MKADSLHGAEPFHGQRLDIFQDGVRRPSGSNMILERLIGSENYCREGQCDRY